MALPSWVFALLLAIVPEAADFLARRFSGHPLGAAIRWELKIAATLVLVILLGFEGGQWRGLGYVWEGAGELIFFLLVVVAFTFGKPLNRPSAGESGYESYHPHRSGRRAPT